MTQLWVAASRGAAEVPFSVYCVSEHGSMTTGPCKVGVASHMVKRLSALQGGNWRPLVLVWQIRLASRQDALDVEQRCLFAHRPNPYDATPRLARLQSEWVEAAPYSVLASAADWLRAVGLPVTRSA